MQMSHSWRYSALRIWARLLLRLERHEMALVVFDEMAQLQPSDEYPLASKAYLLTVLNRKTEAQRLLEKLTLNFPVTGAHWFNLGFLQEESGRYEEACASFTKATQLNPEIDRAWYGLGLVLIRLERFDEAIAALKQNTKLQPMSPYGWYQLARVHMDRQEPDEARKIIRHLKGFEPKVAAQLERETGISVSLAS
jgi:tetratricopeptide (TPR) repeat protein